MLTIETWYGEGPRFDLALTVRRTVFVDEQAVPLDDEIDGKDGEAWHLLALDGDTAVGTARLFAGPTAKIGRVAVLAGYRGRSLGNQLMIAAHRLAADLGASESTLDAQTHVIPFYERLGYVAEGPIFLDAGIPHRRMCRPIVPADRQPVAVP